MRLALEGQLGQIEATAYFPFERSGNWQGSDVSGAGRVGAHWHKL
jgi:hypothetical protein